MQPVSGPPTRTLSYIALVLTLIVALLYIYSALRGHPMAWPSTALLIALCSTAVAGFTQSPGVKRFLAFVALLFACVAIYGLLIKR